MKRFLPVLGIVVMLPVVFAIVIFLSAEKDADGERWRPLPRGGEVALHGVTHGFKHVVHAAPASLLERFKRVVTSGSLRPFSEPPRKSEFTMGGTRPSLAVWVAFRDRADTQMPEKSELILPDGQIFYSWSGGSSTSGGFMSAHTTFPVTPYTAEKLKFATLFDDERFEWEIPNPTYDPSRLSETAEPPPLTQQAGDLQVILHKIKLEPSTHPPSNWRALPIITVSSNGKDVSEWFSIWPEINDGGLLSAPVWRITTRITRSSRYPFAAGEVQWIGTFDKKQADALEAEKYVLFPLDDVATARGIKFAGIFGPGQYEILNGQLNKAGPLPKPKPAQKVSFNWQQNREVLHVNLDEPACVIFDASGRNGVEVFRDADDQPITPRRMERHGSQSGSISLYPVPDKPMRFGVADRNEPSLGGQDLEFLVRPPSPPSPASKDTASKR